VTCETPAHVQSPLEPHAAVARWEGDTLTAWVSTQGIFDARRELARRFDLAPEQVRVISEYIGGAFGAKQGAGVEAVLAAELARRHRAAGPPRSDARAGRRRLRAWTPDRDPRGAAGQNAQAIELAAVMDMGVGGWVFPSPASALPLRLPERPPSVRSARASVRRARFARRASSRVYVLEQAIDDLAAIGSTRSTSGARLVDATRPRVFHRASGSSTATTARRSSRGDRAALRECSPTGSCAAWAARRGLVGRWEPGGAATVRRRRGSLVDGHPGHRHRNARRPA
jgi:hypothetical protein